MNPLPELRPLPGLAAVSGDHQADSALLFSGYQRSAWLAYETARDFLSAPRAFAIVELRWNEDGWLLADSREEYEDIAYLEDGSMAGRGWFVLSDAPLPQHLLFSQAGLRHECGGVTLLPHGQVLHQPSAQAALLHWLQQG